MPTDPSTDPATATTRRTFLARTTVGGAAATAVLAGPFRGLLPTAGAQGDETTTTTEVGVEITEVVTDAEFAAVAGPIELAAIDAYQLALDEGDVSDEWVEHLRQFQGHHRAVADTVSTLASADDPPAVADPGLAATTAAALAAAADEAGVLTALAALEDALSATHLLALETVIDPVTAKIVSQVLTVEAQQATFLALGGGAELEATTPAEATTDDALDPIAVAAGSTAAAEVEESDGDTTTTSSNTGATTGASTTTTEAEGGTTTSAPEAADDDTPSN